MDAVEVLVLLAAAALYVLALAALDSRLQKRTGAPRRLIVRSTAVALVVLSVGLVVFEAVVEDARTVGPDELERQGSDYDRFVALARASFIALYVLVLVIGAGLAYVGGREVSRRALLVGATVLATLVFMVLSLPYVEFLNSCNVGTTVFDGSGTCT